MPSINRSILLGDALSTLGVRRTAVGRRRVIARTQLPFIVLLTIVDVAMAIAGLSAIELEVVLGSWLAVVVFSVVLCFLPWERFAEISGVVVASFDLVVLSVMSTAVIHIYPTIGALQLLPVVILAFAFGLAGLMFAILGSFFTAIFPVVALGDVPTTMKGWIGVLLVPVIISFVAIAVYYFSRLLQATQRRLRHETAKSEAAAVAAEDEQAIFMTVLNTMDVGTAYVRPDDSLAFTNTAFRGIVARSRVDPETHAGTRVFDTDRVTPVPPEEQMLEQAARGEYFDSRLYWIGEPGDQRAVLVSARPVIGHDDQNIGSAFVSKDVTELTDAIRAREDFLAGVSHELRTPLTSIIGYLEVIEDAVDPEAVGISHELGIIQRNANQLMMRIGDLLHLTDESVTLRVKQIDVPRIVQQAVDAIRFRAENAGIDVDLQLCDDFVANVDQGRLAQVLDNLLTNAVKYTPRGGNVTVTLEANATCFTVTVADTGTGIATTELPRVFERFYRAESVRGSAIAGVGLGLAIVRSIVTAHRGKVNVTSTLGTGTTFTVEIPRDR